MLNILSARIRLQGKLLLFIESGLAVACSAVLLTAQAPNPEVAENQALTAIHIPSSAKDMLQVASEVNGLDVGTTKPWHIKFSYDEFDSDGDNVHSGTFEEFYVGSKKYKQIYAGDQFNQIDVANDSGLYRAGDQHWPGMTEYRVRNAVLQPFSRFRANKPNWRLDKEKTKFNTGKLPCLVLHSTGRLIILPSPMACFEPDTVMLRFMSGNLTEDVSYSSIVEFQGQYIAKEIAFTRDGKPFLKIHVDDVGKITKVDDEFFQPPRGATQLTGRITMPSPFYVDDYAVSAPGVLFSRGMDGEVHVKMLVGKDGSVIEASSTDGPEKMREAVLAALRKYHFRPYYILDQPVEVEVPMVFTRHER